MHHRYVIGIDIGTGSTKGVAVAADGAVLASAQSHYATATPQPGYAEQDPQAVWQAFVEVVGSVAGEMGHPPTCVSLSSCMHSLLLLDAHHQPLTQLITWADNRAAAVAERLRRSEEGMAIYTATGTPLHAMSPLYKLIWFRENQPRIFSSIAKAVSIKEVIWWRLFNAFEVDHSVASATGLFDGVGKTWHGPSLAIAGINEELLSSARPTDYVRHGMAADIAEALGLPINTPFCIGASDGCLATVGSGALADEAASLTIGTSGAVRIASGKPLPSFETMPFSYVLDEETFVCGGPVSNGGNVLQWAKQNLLNEKDLTYEEFFRKLQTIPPGADGLLCLPYLHGERAPVWDEKASGVFAGARSHHTGLHFAKAATEGICFALLSVLNDVASRGTAVNGLRISGGVTGSPLLLQTLADVTGRPVTVAQTEDASAVGAALVGLKASGSIPTYAVALPVKAAYEPNPQSVDVYRRGFNVYKTLYATLRSAMHSLSPHNNP